MVCFLRDHASALLAGAVEQPEDGFMAALSRHLDEIAVVQSVPLRIGARFEKHTDSLEVSFARGEMYRGCVPVFRSSEARIAIDQPAQGRRDTSSRRGDRVPD